MLGITKSLLDNMYPLIRRETRVRRALRLRKLSLGANIQTEWRAGGGGEGAGDAAAFPALRETLMKIKLFPECPVHVRNEFSWFVCFFLSPKAVPPSPPSLPLFGEGPIASLPSFFFFLILYSFKLNKSIKLMECNNEILSGKHRTKVKECDYELASTPLRQERTANSINC